MATPTLYRQITEITRIYEYRGKYYLVDAEIDCSQRDAGNELLTRSYASDRDAAKIERMAERNTGR